MYLFNSSAIFAFIRGPSSVFDILPIILPSIDFFIQLTIGISLIFLFCLITEDIELLEFLVSDSNYFMITLDSIFSVSLFP